jgi:Sulfotransferase family
LRKLFPDARFLHLVRDVESVVRSILNFERAGGPRLAQNEEEAYRLWLRAASACQQAEKACGTQVVRRVRHSDLVHRPEETMRSLLHFLEEPFEPACLEPLESRINSSNVPPDFDAADFETDTEVINVAQQLSAVLQSNPIAIEPSAAETSKMEARFNEMIRVASTLDTKHALSVQQIAKLRKEVSDLQILKGSKKFGVLRSYFARNERSDIDES